MMIQGLWAVSYTHLDVYKRQGHGTGSGAGGDGGDEGGEGIESRSQKSCVDLLPGILIIRVPAVDIRKEKGN